MMLILLAGLQEAKPAEVVEAARLDGASAWQTFRYLTLPHLRRYLELGVLLGAVYIVQNFDAVFTITAAWTRHGQPPVHDLPDLLPGPRIRTGVRRGSRRGDRHDHHRHLRAPDRLVPLQ